jgi:voltage-gated potassium channel
MYSSHSYWAVLAAIVAVFFFAALAPDAQWASSTLALLETGALLLALWTAGWSLADARISFGIAAVGVAAAVANLVWTGTAIEAAVGILLGVITIATAVVIAKGAVEQGEVNPRSVAGAICVYVLIGLTFVSVYGLLSVLGSGPFFAQGTDGTRALRLYFSFVTLATLGYGDYTPAGNTGHAFAVVEALIGQLYLVTVVAVVVTRLSHRRQGG